MDDQDSAMMERSEAAHEDAAREHAREGGGEQPVGGALAEAEAVDQRHGGILRAGRTFFV